MKSCNALVSSNSAVSNDAGPCRSLSIEWSEKTEAAMWLFSLLGMPEL